MDGRQWTLTHSQRPWTANSERRWHYQKRAAVVREWRTAFAWLARAERIPNLYRVSICAQPLALSRRWRPDVAACYPAVKAAIDGLVDAGVIPDDDDSHLTALTFLPVKVCGKEGLEITILEE